jgi:hypothetical protein
MNPLRNHYPQVLAVLVISLIAALGVQNPQSAKAQSKKENPPKIYLFILDEMNVCKPSGYASYDSDEPSGCQGPDIDGIRQMKNSSTFIECKLPSSSQKYNIQLGDLFEPVTAYSRRNPAERKVEERQTMVVLLDWGGESISTNIYLKRIGGGGIKPWEWKGGLNKGKSWFNHQRLDAFDPMKNIKWILQIGENEWELSVEKQ